MESKWCIHHQKMRVERERERQRERETEREREKERETHTQTERDRDREMGSRATKGERVTHPEDIFVDGSQVAE
jgi:hypothetical protein